jgi:hypothetical protein
MDKITTLFDVAIHENLNAFPSVYSKEDVNSLLESLKNNVLTEIIGQASGAIITDERLADFVESVVRRLDRHLCSSDLVDTSSAEFSIDYGNQISLDNIDVDTESITSELDDILNDEFSTSFPEFLTNKNQ